MWVHRTIVSVSCLAHSGCSLIYITGISTLNGSRKNHATGGGLERITRGLIQAAIDGWQMGRCKFPERFFWRQKNALLIVFGKYESFP